MSLSQLLYEFELAPFVVQVAVGFIIFSVTITSFAYLLILIRRFRGYIYDKRQEMLEPIIDDTIINQLLFNEYTEDTADVSAIPLDITVLKQAPFRGRANRQILIRYLMQYRKNMRGINGLLLKRIFLELDLDKDSMRKLRSSSWISKVCGLQELTTMDVSIPDVNILPLTNSKNRELRAAARSAYLKLSKNEAFKFFDVVTEPMLDWDQIELFRIITSSEELVIPNFANWISYSPNKTVVEFCIKLAVHYNQVSAADAIVKLLDSHDHELRAHAIHAIGSLKLDEIEHKLLSMYPSQPLQCQIEILKALGKIESGKSYDFLTTEFLYANNFDIRKAAARSLVKSRGITEDTIAKFKEIVTPENMLILNHCMNPLIQF